MLFAANGWTFFYTLVVYNDRTYRVPLLRFRTDMPNVNGPGFVQRPGVPAFSTDEIERMCTLAARVHPSSKAYLQRRFLDHFQVRRPPPPPPVAPPLPPSND